MLNEDFVGKETIMEGELLIIGVGTLGSRIIGRTTGLNPGNVKYAVIDRVGKSSGDMEGVMQITLPDVAGKKISGDIIQASRDIRNVLMNSPFKTDSVILVVLVAGLGGGVGSGALPVLAEHFKSGNIPVVALVGRPDEERDGKKRVMVAELTIKELQKFTDSIVYLDTGIQIPSGDLQWIEKTFARKLTVLTKTLTSSGMIPIDFSCVLKTLSVSRKAAIVSVHTAGDNRAQSAADLILSDPSVKPFLNKPASIVVHIISGPDLTLFELDEAATMLSERWGAEVDVTYGAVVDENFNGLQLDVIIGGGQECFSSSARDFRVGLDSTTQGLYPENPPRNYPPRL